MYKKLTKIIEESNSLEILKNVNSKIPERKFHEFTHILYDIRTLLGKNIKNYVEIGSYIGSSSSLILQHNYPTNIFCIDPLNLNPKHYKGKFNQETTLKKNLDNNNIYNNKITIYKNLSNSYDLLNNIKDLKIDILFIDGCHMYKSVINDFKNYKDKVNRGGFIVFDDYLDKKYSPDVKKAVDYIVEKYITDEFEVIGSIKNIQGANNSIWNFSNEFVLYKK